MLKGAIALVTVIVLLLIASTQSVESTLGEAQQWQKHKRMLLGGFREADVKDKRVVGAANFAVDSLLSGGAPSGKYAFCPHPGTASMDQYQIVIVDATQQVVAGMNYRLTIGLFEKNSDGKKVCVGGFETMVYDNFGTLSVTNWGKEVSCDAVVEASLALENTGGGDS